MNDDQAPAEQPAPTPPERPRPTNVVQALARVIEEMPPVVKDAQYSGGGSGSYAYRSVEAVTAAAQHLLGRYGVVPVPKVLRRQTIDVTVGGKPWTQDELELLYTFYGPGGLDDRLEVGPVWGIGRDNSDKGTTKAMTQAYKVALIQLLCVGDGRHDGDSERAENDSRPVDPEQWFSDVGWMDRQHHDDKRAEIAATIKDAGGDVKTAFRKWYDDQSNAPAWREFWPQPFALAVENRLAQLIAEGEPFEPAPKSPPSAPPQAQEAPARPEGPVPAPTPESPAPSPESASEPVQEPMGWDGLPDPGPEAKEARRRQQIVDHVNKATPAEVTEGLEARGLDIGGTAKARRERLAKALVAEGWTPSVP
jgi:hypothetical protein